MLSSIWRHLASTLGARGLLRLVGLGAAFVLAACIVQQPPPGGGGGVSPQPQPVQATYVQAYDCTQRIGQNGGQGFWDIGLSTCYSCPVGFARTIFDVRSAEACQTGGVFGQMSVAENLGGSGCPQGSFQSGTGCYACPPGTTLDPSAGPGMCR